MLINSDFTFLDCRESYICFPPDICINGIENNPKSTLTEPLSYGTITSSVSFNIPQICGFLVNLEQGEFKFNIDYSMIQGECSFFCRRWNDNNDTEDGTTPYIFDIGTKMVNKLLDLGLIEEAYLVPHFKKDDIFN